MQSSSFTLLLPLIRPLAIVSSIGVFATTQIQTAAPQNFE
jgi:hypothetical protein